MKAIEGCKATGLFALLAEYFEIGNLVRCSRPLIAVILADIIFGRSHNNTSSWNTIIPVLWRISATQHKTII